MFVKIISIIYSKKIPIVYKAVTYEFATQRPYTFYLPGLKTQQFFEASQFKLANVKKKFL